MRDDYRAYDSGKKIERSGNLRTGGRTLNPRPTVAAPTINIRSLLEEVKPEYYEHPEYFWQAVGDKFRAIRDALPEETGEAPLFKRKFSSVRQVLPDLAEIFNRFPDGVTAADGKKVLIKNPEGGSVAKRLMHLIAGVDENSGDRNSFEFSNKIAWIPRIVETVENAQVKLRDPQTGNYAYVRSYSEGAIHSVVVTKNGVVADMETFDHGLITQFAAKYAGRRGEFTVVWERTDGDSSSAPTSANGSRGNDPSALTSNEERGNPSPQSPSTGESSGDAPYSPSAGANVALSLKNVKLLRGMSSTAAPRHLRTTGSLPALFRLEKAKRARRPRKKTGGCFIHNHLPFQEFDIGGERGIRTLGDLRHGGFQDRCLKPLDHFSGFA